MRYSNDRGKVDYGWIQSIHTFLFGDYFDLSYMGVSVLRVNNDNRVLSNNKFAMHSHQDMEIISYIKREISNIGTIWVM